MDRLTLSGQTKLYCLLGDPVAHSLSPVMYNYCFSKHRVDACYLAFRVAEADLPEVLSGLKKMEVAGVNITMPGKKLAAKLADDRDPLVTMTGAANVLVNKEGRLIAYNTDGTGLFFYLKEEGFEPTDKRLVVLGAGGAAVAIVAAAARAGAAQISIFNRRGASYREMAKVLDRISYFAPASELSLTDIDDGRALAVALGEADILINATGVGMAPQTGVSPLPSASLLRPDLPVCDIIYNPRPTRLLKQAAACGARIWDGVGMLLGQGAESYRLFTGLEMPVAEVARAVLGLESF